jgi:hypothetical protein
MGLKLGLILTEHSGQGIFDSRVLRATFGSNTEEVTANWRKFRREDLQDLYISPNIVR